MSAPVSIHPLASCLYQGTLTHRRSAPPREFQHAITMAYLDLAELPALLDGRLLRRFPGLLRFRRADYHGDRRVALPEAIRNTVERELGVRPAGPIRMLTNLRSLGVCFNPVSFYYCFDMDGARLQAVLAEVTNTPWGERQAYVIRGSAGSFEKQMHVSPFMPMDQSYRLRAAEPGEHVSVVIENQRGGEREFLAALRMRRVELTAPAVRRSILRPAPPAIRALALIYGHAVALRISGVQSYAHPGKEAR